MNINYNHQFRKVFITAKYRKPIYIHKTSDNEVYALFDRYDSSQYIIPPAPESIKGKRLRKDGKTFTVYGAVNIKKQEARYFIDMGLMDMVLIATQKQTVRRVAVTDKYE